MTKKEALAKFLEIETDEVEANQYNGEILEADGGEYLVCTDEEADEEAKEKILDLIWAFNPEFLRAHLPDGMTEDVIKAIQTTCEGANEPLKAMIKDLDHFVEDAIGADGRGHFISSYDGEENEEDVYFIYRVN